MTEVVYSQHLQKKASSLKREIDNEDVIRLNQEREIKIMREMEKEITKKLDLLEYALQKMSSQKKKKNGTFYHQRSISNPEDETKGAMQDKKALVTDEEFNRSSDDHYAHKPLYRASQSYDYRRIKRGATPVHHDSRVRYQETPTQQPNRIERNRPHGSAQNLAMSSNEYRYDMGRPKTSGGAYPRYPPSQVAKTSGVAIETRPSPIYKAVSSGITSHRSRDAGNVYETQYENSDAKHRPRHILKHSSGAVNPREIVAAREMHCRSSSAFGMYRTNPSSSNSNSLPRVPVEGRGRTRERTFEMRTKSPVQQEKFNNERSHSMENLIEKRPLAKTNSTILHSSDFKIISLESRTIAQQIKLKELEKSYMNKSRILNKTEWVSFVSEFSETQKEVRNLDNEWQELFSELMSRNTEYNEHMNKIRIWVTALKMDSKFLQDIMSDNLATAL